MTVQRRVDDLDEVVELVKRRFGKQRVVLLGHSWGTALGTIYVAEHPAEVAAYVGTGQIVDSSLPTTRRSRNPSVSTASSSSRSDHWRSCSRIRSIR
jgi:proline iminopeptidase